MDAHFLKIYRVSGGNEADHSGVQCASYFEELTSGRRNMPALATTNGPLFHSVVHILALLWCKNLH